MPLKSHTIVTLSILSSLAVAGCTYDAPANQGEKKQSIIGGTLDQGDPAVVLLISYPQNMATYYTCTAVMIAPDVALTAAHCVDSANHPNYSFGVFLGNDASAFATAAQFAPQLVMATAVHAHPQYNPNAPFFADIGVVLLSHAVNVVPLPVNRTFLTNAVVNQATRLVGYGQTVYGRYNAVKYQASTVVASLGAVDTVAVGDGVRHSCVGDSGGPALTQINGVEMVIGVDSYSDQAGCLAAANYRRTDVYTSFIDQYLPAQVADMTVLQDMTVLHDLTALPDMTVLADMTVSADRTEMKDLSVAAAADLTVPNDLTAPTVGMDFAAPVAIDMAVAAVVSGADLGEAEDQATVNPGNSGSGCNVAGRAGESPLGAMVLGMISAISALWLRARGSGRRAGRAGVAR